MSDEKRGVGAIVFHADRAGGAGLYLCISERGVGDDLPFVNLSATQAKELRDRLNELPLDAAIANGA